MDRDQLLSLLQGVAALLAIIAIVAVLSSLAPAELDRSHPSITSN
jgi:hypothetical protein